MAVRLYIFNFDGDKLMKKKIIKFVCFIFILILPFAICFLVTELIENQYRNTFVAALEDKCDRLNSVEGKKIIFVGGSSLPFGLRSDLIEQEISGYKVVNFGLYATLGTKVMMDLSKMNISKGDIVILAPELSEQTYSLYFNPVVLEEALDGFSFKYKYLSLNDNLSLFYNYYKFALKKLDYSAKKSAPDPIGIYRRDSFNEYGDIAVDRANNIMVNGVDSNMYVYTDDRLLDASFIGYINDYVKYVVGKGAKIYFNFSPTNQLALKSSKAARQEFQNNLEDKLDCNILCNIEDCIINEGYFYDTNFHLNSAGSVYFTNTVINNLKRVLNLNYSQGQLPGGDPDDNPNQGIDIPNIPEMPDWGGDIEVPDNPPEIKTDFDKYKGEVNIDYVDYFNYRLVGSSYQITGVKDGYKDMEEVIIPSAYNGKAVTTLAPNAFYGCTNLKYIHIGLTVRSLEAGCFNGCISLNGIYMYELDGNKISVSSTDLFEGCSRTVKIFILDGANYSTGYTWEHYYSRFETFNR